MVLVRYELDFELIFVVETLCLKEDSVAARPLPRGGARRVLREFVFGKMEEREWRILAGWDIDDCICNICLPMNAYRAFVRPTMSGDSVIIGCWRNPKIL